MKFSIRIVMLILVSLFVLCGAGLALYLFNADLFFAFAWFFVFVSTISHLTSRLTSTRAKILILMVFVIIAGLWFVFNDALFLLISTSVNSNPYGEYFLGQFEFRLLLSIFVLKAILKMWLTDVRLIIAGIFVLFHFGLLQPLFRLVLMSVSSRFFEFFVFAGARLEAELERYITVSLGMALVNSLLWCLAAFLLQFDNFILMTFIMLLFSFIPRIGLFVGAALSLLFVESGLFLIQLGGMLIALASIWFIDHILFKEQDLLDKSIPIFVLPLLPIAGYFLFSFWGLFLAAPLVYMSVLLAVNLSENMPLIHKSSSVIPRKA